MRSRPSPASPDIFAPFFRELLATGRGGAQHDRRKISHCKVGDCEVGDCEVGDCEVGDCEIDVVKVITAKSTLWPGAVLTLLSLVSLTLVSQSQQFAQVLPQPAVTQPPQTQPPASQQAAPPPAVIWENMPRMQLEAEYAGPMKDTAIQRWRDPSSDAVCYLYIPFTAQHSPPMANGYVQYGANSIGNISCLPSRPVAAAAPPKPVSPTPVARVRPAAPHVDTP